MGSIGLLFSQKKVSNERSCNQPTSSLAHEARAIDSSFIVDLSIIDSFCIQSECIPSDK